MLERSLADELQPLSRSNLDAEFLRFLELGAGARPGDDEIGLFDTTEGLGAKTLGLALAPARIFSSAPVNTTILPARAISFAPFPRIDGIQRDRRSSASRCAVLEDSTIASATTSPMPPMEVSSA